MAKALSRDPNVVHCSVVVWMGTGLDDATEETSVSFPVENNTGFCTQKSMIQVELHLFVLQLQLFVCYFAGDEDAGYS